ncbi:MAG: PqqD family protein [Alphaproteobacteria bacterium]
MTAIADMTDLDGIRFAAAGNPIVHESLDGEVVIINLRSGTYYSLSGIGTDLWASLVGGTTLPGLAARLGAATGLTPSVADESARAFLSSLFSEGLVVAERPIELPRVALPPLPEAIHAALALDRFTDVQELLTLDPVHDVDDVGWPVKLEADQLDPKA